MLITSLIVAVIFGGAVLVSLWGYYTYLTTKEWLFDREIPNLRHNSLAERLTFDGPYKVEPYLDSGLWAFISFLASFVLMLLLSFFWTRLVIIIAAAVILSLFIARFFIRFHRDYKKCSELEEGEEK